MPGPGMELIDDEEVREVMEVLQDGFLFRYGISLGPEVDPRFKGKVAKSEQEVCKLVGTRYAVAVNSGTSALLTALSGLGVGPGNDGRGVVAGRTFADADEHLGNGVRVRGGRREVVMGRVV